MKITLVMLSQGLLVCEVRSRSAAVQALRRHGVEHQTKNLIN
jgi:hypothetical protein